MSMTFLLIPTAVVVFGVVFMLVMNKRGQQAGGKAQDAMRRLALQEYPCLEGKEFSVINLLEDAINAQHIWVIAYDKSGMRLIPAKSNPFTQTMEKYEDDTPLFNWKKQLAAHLFVGNKTESNEYLPFAAVDKAEIDASAQKITLYLGGVRKGFKYQMKDCFGHPQQKELEIFFQYLKQGKRR